MRLTGKLLPIAALFALGAMLVTIPAQIVHAHSMTVASTIPLNTPTSMSVNIDAGASRIITLNAISTGVTGSGNAGLFVGSPSPTVSTGEIVSGAGSTTLSFTESATSSARTLTASFLCTQAGTVTFTLFVNGAPQTLTGQTSTTCGSGAGGSGTVSITGGPPVVPQGGVGSYTATANVSLAGQIITISVTPPGATIFSQPTILLNTLPGSAAGANATGVNTGSLIIYTTSAGNYTITGGFNCSQAVTMTLTISLAATGLQGNTAFSQPIVCGTGLVTPTVGLASNVTVAASPTSVGCNGTAFVTVTVRNSAGGYVADGTSVTLTASMGSLSPTTATTLGGGVLAVYTAPGGQSGSATIQASAAGAAQGSSTISVNCQATTPTPAVPPTIFVPQPTASTGGGGGGLIAPPNTGDAGLARDDGWMAYAGIVIMAASLAAAVALVRARS
jgi:hypothetical protein